MFMSLLRVIPKFITILIVLVGLSACSVFDYHDEKTTSSSLVDYLYPQKGEEYVVDKAERPMPHLQLPVRVGIAFVPTSNNWRMSQKGEAVLLNKVKDKFSHHEFIQSIEVIPSTYLAKQGSFTNLKQVARLFDVDVMALVSYDQVQKSYSRDSSLLYLTIVGAYVFKGDANEASTFVDTAVFDVQSETMLFRAPGVNQSSANSTSVDQERVQDAMASKGFDDAVLQMSANLERELSVFKERVKNGEVARVSYRKGKNGQITGGGGSMSIVILLQLFFTAKLKLNKTNQQQSHFA